MSRDGGEEKLCNKFPGNSRCMKDVAQGTCPGIKEGKCCSKQQHNVAPTKIPLFTTISEQNLVSLTQDSAQ